MTRLVVVKPVDNSITEIEIGTGDAALAQIDSILKIPAGRRDQIGQHKFDLRVCGPDGNSKSTTLVAYLNEDIEVDVDLEKWRILGVSGYGSVVFASERPSVSDCPLSAYALRTMVECKLAEGAWDHPRLLHNLEE